MLAIWISCLEAKLPVVHKRTASVCHDVTEETVVWFSSVCCKFLSIAFDTHQKEESYFMIVL